MKLLSLSVLLFCLVAYGHGRPSDTEDQDDIVRDSRKEKIFQQSRAEHRSYSDSGAGDEEEVQAIPFYGSGKGKFLIIHPSGKTTVEDQKPMLDGPKDDEEDVGQEGDGDSGSPSEEPPNESVSVNLPPDNASVAEAKPVGLAIAGIGGVASSKPVATAVVGPGGLALAKPVATAIAGIPGAEALVGVAGNGGKSKNKAATAAAAAAATSQPTKKVVPGGTKTKRSAAAVAFVQRSDSEVWPTYPLYKIPESHAWGFILRPVNQGGQA